MTVYSEADAKFNLKSEPEKIRKIRAECRRRIRAVPCVPCGRVDPTTFHLPNHPELSDGDGEIVR